MQTYTFALVIKALINSSNSECRICISFFIHNLHWVREQMLRVQRDNGYILCTYCMPIYDSWNFSTNSSCSHAFNTVTWFLSMVILFWPKERFKNLILVNRTPLTPLIYGQPVKTARCLWPGQISRVLQYWNFKT